MARTPQEILQHHDQAVFANDAAAMKEDYTDDAVLITMKGVFKGPDKIAQVLQQLVADMPNMRPYDNPNVGMTVEGDTVFLRWALDSDAGTIKDAFDTIVCKDGKIWRQTTNFVIEPK